MKHWGLIHGRIGAAMLRWIIIVALLQAWTLTCARANPVPVEAADASTVFSATAYLTQRETLVALAVLVFGFIVGVLALLTMRHQTLPPENVIRLSAMILIVTGVLFLVSAGYDTNQIAPALGLLGTIAGYMLGRADRSHFDRRSSSQRETNGEES